MNWYQKIKLAGLPVIKERVFRKKLNKLGCFLNRSRGSHQIWNCPGGRILTIPFHGAGDMNPGTIQKIITQDLGMNIRDFLNL